MSITTDTNYPIHDDPHGFARMYGYIDTNNAPSLVPKFYRDKYEKEANKYWDKFYSNNANHFFKNRNWIEREFPELLDEKNKRVLEIGCGVGNTTFPLLERNDHLQFTSFDFSKIAVENLMSNPLFSKYCSRCSPFVYDISTEELPDIIEPNTFDVAIIIFVLSAISPTRMEETVKRIWKALKPGGLVLFRDYAENDILSIQYIISFPLTVTTFGTETLRGNDIDELPYMVRGDGTLSFYFSLEFLENLFIKCGFSILENTVVPKEVTNRKQSKHMNRLFTQGKYIKIGSNPYVCLLPSNHIKIHNIQVVNFYRDGSPMGIETKPVP